MFFFGVCNVSCHVWLQNICKIQKLCQNIVNERQRRGRRRTTDMHSVKNHVSSPLHGGLTKGQLQLNRHV